MRRKPVTRNEVRIAAGFQILTIPADSVESPDEFSVEPVERLWRPLVKQLAKEGADEPQIPRPWGSWLTECRRCGRGFYTVRGAHTRYCSDTCARLSRAEARAASAAVMVKARSEARAEARAGRTCLACGAPLETQRATKRFCSTKCRMRGHRQRI